MKTEDSRKKLVCLFGSGTSLKAGMPATRKITLKLLYEPEFWIDDDATYNSGPKPVGRPEHPVQPARYALVRDLIREVYRAYRSYVMGRADSWYTVTYEDIAFLIDRLWRQRAVPRLDPAIELIEWKMKSTLRPRMEKARLDWNELLRECLNRIADLVWQELARPITSTAHFRFLGDMTTEVDCSDIAIVTTNHDLVLETYLQSRELLWTDGFESAGKRNRIWQPELFDTETPGICLFKLHGAVNWFRARSTASSWTGIVANLDDLGSSHPIHGLLKAAWNRPLLLIGTENKREDYTFDIFAELYCRARRAIMNCTNLLVCGYGFGDRGINQMIWDWAFGRARRALTSRLIVAHKSFNNLTRTINPGVHRELEELRQLGVLVPVEGKWAEELDWADIEPHIILS